MQSVLNQKRSVLSEHFSTTSYSGEENYGFQAKLGQGAGRVDLTRLQSVLNRKRSVLSEKMISSPATRSDC
ncbi:hypothetical protein MRB53_027682 [Persea americana]|uniref:Uncharacterized protein n=1 Tax=Persea americana TaxID=3435 RepID=A0ACC2LLJ9_PERAE|nr:hypothetical protein MRB53_027682 [Persea americana]